MNIKKVIILIIIYLCIPILLNAQYVEWVRRYNGPVASDYNDDEPSAIAVDAQGNVYVTGSSVGRVAYPFYYYDWATIKYYPNGDTAWVRRYDGPISRDDYARALAVDNQGNVYVTGSSYTSDSTGYDWLTIKYNTNGDIVWSKRFNGTENQYDEAQAITLDNNGNVYVTGYTHNSIGWTDYTTIKYYSNGDTAWVRHYNGPFNSEDEACAIAVDNQGNVYVTGKSYGPGYWYDIATIKYNSSGVQQWVSRYTYTGNNNDEARSIAVDNQGNVYVTGLSMDPGAYYGGDCITIKYLSNGDTAWVRRYNGTANDWDEGKDIAVDNLGNVYVTGLTSVPGQYGPQVNYLTIKYNSLGSQQWLQRYNLPDSTDCYNIANAIALDTFGNIYITGQSQGSNYYNDFATIKYSPAGIQKWVVRYNGSYNRDDEAVAMTVDLVGNIYVTGTSEGNDNDYATIKYYQAGANDVGVDSIIYPPEQHLRLMPMKPCALVRNFGTSPQTNFPVVCSIIGPNNSLRYTSTKIISYLADYDTIRVYFDTWTPTVKETCTVKMRTNLIGDQDPNNDRKTRITEITNAVLLLSEGFNNPTFPPLGWRSEIVQGGYEWQRRTFNTNPTCSPYEGSAMASYQSYNAPYGSKARLISRPINLGTQPKTCILNFAMYHDAGSPSASDSIKIEYSTDGINFTRVAAFSRYQPYSYWDEHSVELGTFTGTIYFGILAFSGNGRNMNIDLVQLYGTLPLFNDVAVDEIISPSPYQQAGSPITPIARIKNYGLNTQSNFPVVCSIISPGGILRYTNTQNIPLLLSGDTVQVNFASWTPDVEEVCMVKIRTLLANDENSKNDQKTKQTEISCAQILLSEGFNDTIFPPLGWQSVIINGSYNWERKTSNVDPLCIPYEGVGMASYQSYYAYEGSTARLISPPINLGTTPIPCTLKFFMYHDPGYQYNPDSVKIEYSFDGTNFTTVTTFGRYAPTEGWTNHSVYLGTFSGTIYIGILAYSGCGNNMNIDYVRLTKTPQYTNDVGVEAIIQPISTHTVNSQMAPIARIRNFGTTTQTNFSVTCSILGISSELLSKIQDTKQLLTADLLSLLSNADYVVRYTDTVRISSLAPSETTRVNFRTWTPTIIEPCIIRIRTNLSIDQNPYNNFKDQITSITQYQYFIVEGFNDTTFPPPGWQSVIINGSYNWERKTSNENPDCLPYEGSAMASYQSYSASVGSMARLISPPIALGLTPVPCNLKFFMYHDPGYPSDYGPDSVKIEYSLDGTNFTRVTAFRRYEPIEGWIEHSVYLGTFSGTIYLGILAFSQYGNNMNIDYVRVYTEIPLANDVGVDRIISPGTCQIPNTLMPITAWVKNYGNNPQTNFPVTCSVIGTAKTVRYTNTV
ncbi:MAG: SBBP repeat-containing protein, partial [candidate division WOR-3 bacterium]